MRYSTLFAIALILCASCNNLEDAGFAKLKTFTRIYENPYNMTATDLEETPNGYVILGNRTVELEDTVFTQTVLLEVDKNGGQIGDLHAYDGGTGKSFKYIDTGTFQGYVIIGDSIYIDPLAEQAANVTISSMRVMVVNSSFNQGKKIRPITDRVPISETHPVKLDFFGGSVNLTNNGLVFLGSYKEGVINQQAAPEKQLLFSVDFDLDSAWFKTYDLIGNTNSNSRSIHYNDGHILWATSVLDIQGEFTTSYVAIPYVAEGSEFENNSTIGLNTTQSFIAKDIHPALLPEFGYGVVGTYSQATDGSEGNMFFFRVSQAGNIVPGSDRYFDGIQSFKSDSLDINKNFSSIVDEGETICSTTDGGFILAGSFTTNPQKGNGGKDIFLVKVNLTGNIIWTRTYGAGGDETVSAIRETSSGELIICGTNNLGGYSSIFLMKIDKNGELKN